MKIKYSIDKSKDFISFDEIKKYLLSKEIVFDHKNPEACSYMKEPYEVWKFKNGYRFCISPVRIGWKSEFDTILLSEGRQKVIEFINKIIDEN